MNLSEVSRTAILTLIARVVASEKENAGFTDPMATPLLEGLISVASTEEKNWMIGRKRFYAGISPHDAIAGARRAKTFDDIANRYVIAHPGCTVINLACGFDTRFWRIAHRGYRYIEIDLPEVVALKRELLKDEFDYELIGCPVQNSAWIDQVTTDGNRRFLLLAEGLLMFLPQSDVTQLFQRIAEGFTQSQFAFDMVPKKYLKGIWKGLLRLEMKINWGVDASWLSGIADPGEIEAYGSGLRVIGQAKGSAGPIITVSINAA